MRLYTLTLSFPDSPSVSASKPYRTRREALRWQSICEDICGRNHLGSRFDLSHLASRPVRFVK